MEKIITIQYTNKTYNPTETASQTSLLTNNVAYRPNLIERIIKNNETYFLLSNLGLHLTTQKGDNLVYGK